MEVHFRKSFRLCQVFIVQVLFLEAAWSQRHHHDHDSREWDDASGCYRRFEDYEFRRCQDYWQCEQDFWDSEDEALLNVLLRFDKSSWLADKCSEALGEELVGVAVARGSCWPSFRKDVSGVRQTQLSFCGSLSLLGGCMLQAWAGDDARLTRTLEPILRASLERESADIKIDCQLSELVPGDYPDSDDKGKNNKYVTSMGTLFGAASGVAAVAVVVALTACLCVRVRRLQQQHLRGRLRRAMHESAPPPVPAVKLQMTPPPYAAAPPQYDDLSLAGDDRGVATVSAGVPHGRVGGVGGGAGADNAGFQGEDEAAGARGRGEVALAAHRLPPTAPPAYRGPDISSASPRGAPLEAAPAYTPYDLGREFGVAHAAHAAHAYGDDRDHYDHIDQSSDDCSVSRQYNHGGRQSGNSDNHVYDNIRGEISDSDNTSNRNAKNTTV